MKSLKDIKEVTVRDGDDCWMLECRFSNGEKYAPIAVDCDEEQLADEICALIMIARKKEPR